MKRLVRSRLWLLVAALVMTIAACGGDNDEGAASGNDGGSGSDGISHQDASPEDLEIWQTDLNAVGCYAGRVDGSLGPQTESAIKAFQTAKDLRVDGLLGPQTKGALEEAVAAGEIVCAESGEVGEGGSATEYDATASVPCGIDGSIDTECDAGVKREFFEDGTTVVEITRPDGLPRTIFFMGIEAVGADSAEADGSAGYEFSASRDDDWTVIEFGPERYRIPDALVVGG